MKTTIVTGLLGSGKTTFIRNRLQDIPEKTVVLVNDFGKAGIDGEIFSAAGIESVELPSGCVCCSLKFDLVTTITRIVKEFSPAHLVIEPSGVASPSGVLEALGCAGITSFGVIGLVDVTEFADLYRSGMYGGFFEDQLVNSDMILVNKVDLADEGTVVEAIQLIETINPHALLFRTVNAQVSREDLPLSFSEKAPPVSARGTGLHTMILSRSRDHFRFETLSFRLNGESTLARFSAFFDMLAGGGYGRVVRAKALITFPEGVYRFDAVFGKVDRAAFGTAVHENRLVVIGEGLEKEAIEKGLSLGNEA